MRQSRLLDYQVGDAPAYENEDLLRELYLEDELSSYEIADELDCHPSTVQRYLGEFGITTRGPNGTKEDALYKQEEWLQENYIKQERPASELADEVDVSRNTIYLWLEKHEIDRRSPASVVNNEARYADEEWLRRKYLDEGLSSFDIAEITDVVPETIQTWLHRFNIPVRDEGRPPLPYARMYVDSNGYIAWRSYNSETNSEEYALVHRLLVVAYRGLDALRGNHVHHKNHIKWDNRIENLELIAPEEHAHHHGKHQDEYRERDEKGRYKVR